MFKASAAHSDVAGALELGEYALAEILPEGMNLFLWDFGVDSQASGHPQNRPPLAPSKASGKGQQKQ